MNGPYRLSRRSFHLTTWSRLLPAALLLLAFGREGRSQVTETFNSNGTFTAPAGVTSVTVECWGGGGRGATRSSNGVGGGGGGGAYARSVLTVIPGNDYTVTVGAGSTGTGPGGDSWFGSSATILAKGGNSSGNNSSTGAAGGSGAASIGDVVFSGGNGANGGGGTGGGGGSSAGTGANGSSGIGQAGGTAPAGGGDGGDGGNGVFGFGAAGASPGGGGGGAERVCCFTVSGGNGAGGRVTVTYVVTPPANDDCGGAVVLIPGTSCVPVTGDVANATQSIPAITCNSFTGDANDDVWYSFVAAATSETIEVTGSADFDAVVDLRDGCTGSTIDCADATLDGGTEQIVATGLTVGNTYYVRVYHYFTAIPATTDFDICVYHLAGDECTTAVTANDGANAFTTVGTPAAPDVTSCSTGDVFDTWFTYTATCTGTLVISTCDDATFNTSLGVYDACGGTELACNDDAAGCTGSTSEVSLSATSGEVFLIRVAGTGGATGSGNVNISCFPSVLYSQASGNTSDPIWDVVPVGTPGAAVFSPFTSVVVQNGDVVTADADLDVNDLTVETGATLVLDNGVTLSVHGSSLDVDGTLTGNDNSVLELVGTSATTMASAATLDLFDLTVNTPAGTTTDATIEVRGTLQLDGGAFDASAGDVTLISTATETARLGPVDATASYTGDLRVQRHVPAGVTNWRLLSGSVTGATLQQWDQDFLTAGFPGSDFPGFDNPVGSGILWPSIRVYDETDAGAGLTDGLEGVGNVTDALTTGVGFAAWCGDNLVSTTAFTIDVVGPPVVASTPVALPVSYTNTGVPATDGWNLVGNPLASPIDFGALSLGADVENEFWVFDPVAGNNVFWNETLGLGSSVMNGNIQSSQGFWLHATGAAVTTTVDESAKVLDPNGGAPFGGMLLQNDPILRLGLHSQLNQFSDETLLHFGAGQPDNDGPDMEKFFFAHPEAPQLWSSGADGVDLALNAWGGITAPVTIPVKVQTWVAGSYTLEVMQHTQPMDDLCVVLEDVVTGVSTPLETGASYSFTLASGVPADPARFLLHVAPAPQGVLTASAQQVLVGEPVQFSSGTQPGTPVSWEFGDGSTSTDPDPVHAYGLPGNYPVQLTIGQAPCDLVLTEVIEVSVSTDLPALDDEAFRAWMDGSAIRLRWDLGGADVHEVKVYDPRGREVRALRLAEASGQATIDMADQPHGVYVLRLQSDRLLRTVKLPVVR